MLHPILLAILVLVGCQKDEPDKKPSPLPLPYEFVADRALDLSEPDGWIVNRYDNGLIRTPGDALLFTGMALGALDCERGAVPEAALTQMFTTAYGDIYRHPSMRSIPASLDGALGLYWGIHHRIAKCPASRSVWVENMRAFDPHARKYLEVIFEPVHEQVMAGLGLGMPPSEEARGRMGAAVAAWAFGVVQSKSAAYRLHLGYLALSVVDAHRGKVAYCESVTKAEISLLEHFCGRPGLASWVKSFQINKWEYHHQRAIWESPDGEPFLNTPGLDYLVALEALN